MSPQVQRRRRHGATLRDIRLRLGWTLKRMAREFLLSRYTVWGMEHGRAVSRESMAVYVVLARRSGLDCALVAVLEAT